MKKRSYIAVLRPAIEGGFNVFIPALPGCCTQGNTLQDAVLRAEEAIRRFLEAKLAHGEALPEQEEPSVQISMLINVEEPVPKLDPMAARKMAEEIRAQFGNRKFPDSTETIRRHRDG